MSGTCVFVATEMRYCQPAFLLNYSETNILAKFVVE